MNEEGGGPEKDECDCEDQDEPNLHQRVGKEAEAAADPP